MRSYSSAAGLLFIAALFGPSPSVAACTAVAVDRSDFYHTAQQAIAALKPDMSGTPMVYPEGSPVAELVKRVAAKQPRLVVLHYSMFNPGDANRVAVVEQFIDALERRPNRPQLYVIYSSSFHHPVHRRGGVTLQDLRKRGYFVRLPDARIQLIYVPEGGRFIKGDGGRVLRQAALRVIGPKVCRR